MLKLTISVHGINENELEIATEEILKKLKEGFRCGHDEREDSTGEYTFGITDWPVAIIYENSVSNLVILQEFDSLIESKAQFDSVEALREFLQGMESETILATGSSAFDLRHSEIGQKYYVINDYDAFALLKSFDPNY